MSLMHCAFASPYTASVPAWHHNSIHSQTNFSSFTVPITTHPNNPDPIISAPKIALLTFNIMDNAHVQRSDGSMVLVFHYGDAGRTKGGEWWTWMPKCKAWIEFGYPVRLDYRPQGAG